MDNSKQLQYYQLYTNDMPESATGVIGTVDNLVRRISKFLEDNDYYIEGGDVISIKPNKPHPKLKHVVVKIQYTPDHDSDELELLNFYLKPVEMT